MKKESSGIYTVPCEVNGLPLRFILDTGASNVTLSKSEANLMKKNGYIKDSDIVGSSKAILADGSITENTVLNIREIKIGSYTLHNVRASIVNNDDAPLLLGQTVLSNVGKWSIDGDVLVLLDAASTKKEDWSSVKEKVKEYFASDDYESAMRMLKIVVKAGNKEALYMYFDHLDIADENDKSEIEYCVGELKKLAAKKDAKACMALGLYYYRKNNNQLAISYYKATIGTSSYAEACYGIGEVYFLNLNDEEKAAQWYKISADKGYQYAITCYTLYLKKKNRYQEVIRYYNKAISAGLTTFKEDLADLYLEGEGVQKNVQKGITLLASLNNVTAWTKLAEYYIIGTYVHQDITKGKYYLHKIPYSDYCGDRFESDFLNGIICDYEKSYYDAKDYLEQALNVSKDCSMQRPGLINMAHIILGEYYELGKGMATKNTQEAYVHYLAAADNGDESAFGYLGDLYKHIDINKAWQYYKQGADNEDAYCSQMIGLFYQKGIVVNENAIEAQKWFKKAKSLGYRE